MIVIVDYGMGNSGSILNMLKRIGAPAIITSDPELVGKAEKILLPGVGAFDSAMERINAGGMREVLNRKALVDRIPILGICLGMQLLTNASEEGTLPGLGWVSARTRRFPSMPNLKVPHMGWNLVSPVRKSPLTEALHDEARFYFVHSFCVHVENQSDSLLKAVHGIPFDAAIQRDNVYGVQFHPEKSHKFGMKLLANFTRL